MATVTRRDIGRVKVRDVDFDAHQDVLLARMRAVLTAQQAARVGEVGAHPALRQSLVDLAAIAELLAENLAPPTAA